MTQSFIANDTLGLTHFGQATRPVLAYACQYCGCHIERTRTRIDTFMIVRFIRVYLLSWLEAMSGLDQSYFAFRPLEVLSNWVEEMETGKFAASGSYDRTVRVWNVKTRETVFGPFNGHSGDANYVVFSRQQSSGIVL